MTATVAGIHLGLDTHANRPAANTVPDGSIYSCSTHNLVYKSNFSGNSWATWASLAGTGAPTTSKYITAALDAGLSAEIARPELDDYATSGGSDITFTSPTDENANLTSTTETDMLRKITCVNTTIYHCYVSSSIGTGNFDIRARIADVAITVPHTAASLPLFGMFLADSSLTLTTRLSIWGQWPATTNLERDYVAASSNTVTVLNQKCDGVKLPVILRITRASTTVTYYYSTNEGRFSSQAATATSSLNVARVGFILNGGSVGAGATSVALVHWFKSF